MEGTADIPYVVVMRIAIAAPAPKPGKTPTNVPKRSPMKQLSKLEGRKMIENP